MDRRYLVATLALVATFAVVSHELRDGRVAVLASRQISLLEGHCSQASSAPERIVSEMTARLRPAPAEEASMLAEMNLPMIQAQARVAALAERQEMAAARCARETALRDAERARRDAIRAREEARRAVSTNGTDMRPIVLELNELPEMTQTVRVQMKAFQRDVNTQAVRLQLASNQLPQIRNVIEVATSNLAIPEIPEVTFAPRCPSQVWTKQMQVRYTRALRNAMHAVQNSVHGADAGVGKNAGYL